MSPFSLFAVLLLALLIIGTVCLPWLRSKRWGLAVWIPVIALDIRILVEILGPLPKATGHSPDSGFVGMEVGFYLMFALPFIIGTVISLLVAAIAFPRKAAWTVQGGVAGVAIAATVLFMATNFISPDITVRVVDENGGAVPDALVHFSTFSFGSGKPLGSKHTNQNGEVKMRLPRENWSANAKGKDGMEVTEAGIGLRRVRDSRDPDELELSYWWYQHDWGKLNPRFAVAGHFRNQRVFEIRFRKKGEIHSRWFALELHRRLLEVLNEGRHINVLHDMCDNIESFDELPLLGQITAKTPSARQAVAHVLQTKADIVKYSYQTVVARERKNENSGSAFSYTSICRWFGLDNETNSVPQTAPQIRIKLQKLANDLLDTAEPLWQSEGPIAYAELEALAKPAAPQLLRVIESATGERWSMNYWQALEKSQPDPDQVRPFLSSANSMTAAAAINAVKRRLSPEDATLALDKLRAISHPGENSWFQHQLDELIPTVTVRTSTSGTSGRSH